MKLQAKDLMIDDLVYIKDHPIKSQPQKVKPEHFVRSLVEFEPIPLTPELLEKNGFNHIAECEWEYNDTSCSLRFAVSPEEMGKERIFAIAMEGATFDIEMTIDYVHELQHALRLCGIEKSIEL